MATTREISEPHPDDTIAVDADDAGRLGQSEAASQVAALEVIEGAVAAGGRRIDEDEVEGPNPA